jgi:hypothetical protein
MTHQIFNSSEGSKRWRSQRDGQLVRLWERQKAHADQHVTMPNRIGMWPNRPKLSPCFPKMISRLSFA